MRDPAIEPVPLDARWALTQPILTGQVNVATSGGDVYVVDAVECGTALAVLKIDLDGRIEWRQQLGDPHKQFQGICPETWLGVPIAANPQGVVVAMSRHGRSDVPGVTVFAFDPRGTQRWQRDLQGDVDHLMAVATADRTALCMTPVHGLAFDGAAVTQPGYHGRLVLELDQRGARIGTHVATGDFGSATCSYDEANQLWLTTSRPSTAPISIDGVSRAIPRGTQAIRLGGRPKYLGLYPTAPTWIATVPSGFVVYQDETSMEFIDLDGRTRWRIELRHWGCRIVPQVLEASATRLLARLELHCGRRSGAKFCDLEIQDQSSPQDRADLSAVVVELDPTTQRSRSLWAIPDLVGIIRPSIHSLAVRQLTVASTSSGLFAFGTFSGALGLGTQVQSSPATYRCDSGYPRDDSYSTTTPSCKPGYGLHTSYPYWPFVVVLH